MFCLANGAPPGSGTAPTPTGISSAREDWPPWPIDSERERQYTRANTLRTATYGFHALYWTFHWQQGLILVDARRPGNHNESWSLIIGKMFSLLGNDLQAQGSRWFRSS